MFKYLLVCAFILSFSSHTWAKGLDADSEAMIRTLAAHSSSVGRPQHHQEYWRALVQNAHDPAVLDNTLRMDNINFTKFFTLDSKWEHLWDEKELAKSVAAQEFNRDYTSITNNPGVKAQFDARVEQLVRIRQQAMEGHPSSKMNLRALKVHVGKMLEANNETLKIAHGHKLWEAVDDLRKDSPTLHLPKEDAIRGSLKFREWRVDQKIRALASSNFWGMRLDFKSALKLAQKGLIPAAVAVTVGAAATLANSTAAYAEPSSTVGSAPAGPQHQSYDDDSFGPPGLR